MSDGPNEDFYPPSVGAAQSYVESLFGGPVTEIDKDFSLSSGVVTKLTSNNPDRLALTILNLGAGDAYVAFDNLVSSTHGIYLAANGGYVSMTVRDDLMLQCRNWYAQSPSAGTDLYLIETYRYALT